jgi:hypothetical protein
MSNRTFAIVVIVVLALVAGVVYMHRPRSRASLPAPHGQR